jgi:CubicO group peptidase (beta-lactamase class C family)
MGVKTISELSAHGTDKKDTCSILNPGERFSYCNSGYTTLGYIVAKVSGKSYSEYLSDEFFKPLGMNNSGVYCNSKRPENEAIGYTFENGKMVNAPDWDMSWAAGAGAIYSTVVDLYTWNEAVFNGKVLSPISLKQAFTPVVLNDPIQPRSFPMAMAG